MNCTICRKSFIVDDRIIVNERVTFAFKPSTVEHLKSYKVSPNDLLEGGFVKTETASTFLTFDGDELDKKYFNQRHVECSIPHPRGTSVIFSKNPIVKHGIRYNRSLTPKGSREVHKH